jgi:hypothetical protein
MTLFTALPFSPSNSEKKAIEKRAEPIFNLLFPEQTCLFRNQPGSIAHTENSRTYEKRWPVEEAVESSSILLSPVMKNIQSFFSYSQTSPFLCDFYFLERI